MLSELLTEGVGGDRVWRGRFALHGYEITASLDLALTERITRLRAGIEDEDARRTEGGTWALKLWPLLLSLFGDGGV